MSQTDAEFQGQVDRLRAGNEPLLRQDYSRDKRLNRLLNNVVGEVRLYAEDQIAEIRRLAQIGIALSAEKNLDKLLETIVDEARSLSHADGGTLYIVDQEQKALRFEIVQAESLKTRMGGTTGVPVSLPPLPLEIEGKPNYANVSCFAALTGNIANISDVYKSDLFDFTGPRRFDETTGYHSKSMLVIPLKNHENDIIGVLQLVNASDQETGEIISFSEENVDLIASLASQAAVALTNTQLILELKNLLYAFIKSIAAAIDDKSPYTGGHINRVVELTLMIAELINRTEYGCFESVCFSEDQLEELRVAAWMHDVGKITTPEYVIDKHTRLETVFDRIELVRTRFELIRRLKVEQFLREKIARLEAGKTDSEGVPALEAALEAQLRILDEERDFLVSCNNPNELMSRERIERLEEIGRKTYSVDGAEYPVLTENEIYNLSIPKGTLTDEERKVIEHHAEMTLKILEKLPFPKKLANVPKIAAFHHEKMDGSGYPFGLKAGELPIGSRIMAVADIFEALTAQDRPYKLPMKLSQAVKILGVMKNDRHIDPDIYDLFINSKIYRQYAEKELNPDQIDDG
jgi:HD-GYP domain-containing protein (c-di-GMP phosphodiesterase class II)